MRSLIGIILLLLGSGGIVGEVLRIKIPSASWFFDTSRRVPYLTHEDFPWFGWAGAVIAIIVGACFLTKSLSRKKSHPSEIMRRERFKEVKRGVWSLWIILFLVLVASLDFLIVGDRPLIMKYEGETYYPAFDRKTYFGKDLGVGGELAEAPVNFRSLQKSFEVDGENWLVMPVIPYAPTGDTLPPIVEELKQEDGVYQNRRGEPYSGYAVRTYPTAEGSEEVATHIRYQLRDGKYSGAVAGWDLRGEKVYSATYKFVEDEMKLATETYFGGATLKGFKSATPESLQKIHYHPAPPTKEHWLGTDSKGNDVLAYVFGGLQVSIVAALFYIPFVYVIGVVIGLLMGYFGGAFDLVLQRVIETLESIPFLFVIIIISSSVPTDLKGLGMILMILILFGWMGITYLMRTAAYREKARDYVASARVLGASTPRVLFKHVLPNTVSIIVTMIPFAVSGVVTSITALDYLGFGLPPRYASWGKLLNDGLANLTAPWLVTSAFVILVVLLTLVTFVGEAVREAWDPKKYTIYK